MNNVDLNFDKSFRHEYFEKYAIIFNKFNKIKFKSEDSMWQKYIMKKAGCFLYTSQLKW